MVIILALALVFFLDTRGSKSSSKQLISTPEVASTPEAPVATPSNDLPMLPLTTLDGTKLMVNELEGSTVLVLFQPDCDHCQREATQIREHIEAFEHYKVYFVSDAGIPQLSQFAETYKLAGQSNVYFAQTSINEILNQVGPIEAPSLFVYSPEGRLVKSFIGETPIEEILKVL